MSEKNKPTAIQLQLRWLLIQAIPGGDYPTVIARTHAKPTAMALYHALISANAVLTGQLSVVQENDYEVIGLMVASADD